MQTLEGLEGAVRIGHHDGFRQFDYDVLRLQVHERPRSSESSPAGPAAELSCRQIYRNTQIGKSLHVPPAQLLARGFRIHRPICTMRSLASASGMNSSGGTQPRVGWLPARQRLETDNSAAGDLYLGLIVQAQLAELRRDAQIVFELQTLYW